VGLLRFILAWSVIPAGGLNYLCVGATVAMVVASCVLRKHVIDPVEI
jgi:hypothetical protein